VKKLFYLKCFNENNMHDLQYLKKNWAKICSFILSSVSMFFVVSLAFFTWKWADDFCLFNDLHKESLWMFAWDLYKTWDGRGLMIGLTSGFAMKYLPVVVTNTIWASALIGSAYFIYKIIIYEVSFLNKNRVDSIIQIAAITIVLWLGMSIHISETVYWSTGGYYILSAFFGLAWSYILIKIFKGRSNAQHIKISRLINFFIISILIGMFSHNLSTGLLALGFLSAIISWMKDGFKSMKLKNIGLGTLGILIGTFIISVAPGNFTRASRGQRSFHFSAKEMSSNFMDMFEYYRGISINLVILGIILALLLTLLINNRYILKKEFIIDFTKKIRIPFDRRLLIVILDKSKFMLAALATILPFIFVPDFGAPRTSIFFMIFLLIFILSFFPLIFKKIFYTELSTNINYEKKVPSFVYLLFSIVFVSYLFVIIPHNLKAYEIKKKIIKREMFLSEQGNENKDIIAKKLRIKNIPFSLRFTDISDDSTNWVNGCVAEYYNLKSISIEK